MWLLWLLWILSLSALTFLGYRHYGVLKKVAQREERNVFGLWPVNSVNLDEIDPIFRLDNFGPTLDTQVNFIGRGSMEVIGGTSDAEAWVLAVLAKKSSCMFEFGTCTGKTSYLWAVNSAPEARITTLTLPPEFASPGDVESRFKSFIYSDTPAEMKITQLFGDSLRFDVVGHESRYDLIFVDGSHHYDYVVNDTQKALEMVKPGGLVLWHDYCGAYRNQGVYRALNELSRRVCLRHIKGSTLVFYRRPS